MELGDSIIGLLPLLVSGYLFNLIFYPFRFFTGRADGQRLFFMSAGSGLIIGAIAFGLSYAASIAATTFSAFEGWLPNTIETLHQIIPISWIGSLLLTIILGPVLAFFGNGLIFLFRKLVATQEIKTSRWIYGEMNSWFGSPLARLLRQAADDQKLVLVNLSSRKVYCGRIMEAPLIVDGENAYIELLPKFSTYRDQGTLALNRNVLNYPAFNLWESQRYRDERRKLLNHIESRLADTRTFWPFYQRMSSGTRKMYEKARTTINDELEDIEKLIGEIAPPNFNVRDWIKVIPCSEVESASFFDDDAFKSWFSDPNEPDVAP